MTYISFVTVLIIGFAAGFVIPAVASRFGKILPADPGLVLTSLWHKPHWPKNPHFARYLLLKQKWYKLLVYSLCWAMIMSGLFCCAYVYIGPACIIWTGLFLWLVGLSIAVDEQYFLLPDFMTVPLLFLGGGFAAFTGLISPADAFLGALFGYLLSMISVCVMNMFRHAEFGAGDVKMVTALGAWFGYFGLNVTLVLSFLFFAAWAVWRKKRTGAFGPALGIAAIFVLFGLFAK